MSETTTPPGGFSATDAGLAGFRILRERPTIWPAWAIASLAVSVAMVVPLVLLAGPALVEFQEIGRAGAGATPDPGLMIAILGRIMPAVLIVLAVSIIYSAVMYAAANRVVMRPKDGGFGWFRLGDDEVRQGLVLLLLFAIILAVTSGAVIVASILAGLAAAATPILGGLVGLLAVFALIGGFVYIGVRLSLVSPHAFATGRINIREAWNLTKGRFAPMLGAFFLSIVVAMIISMLATGVFFLAALPIFGLGATSKAVFEQPDMTSMATMFPPVGIAWYIWQCIVAGVTSVVTSVVAPTIYQKITGGEQTVFD